MKKIRKLLHGGSDRKASVYNAGDLDSIPGLGRSPGEGNGDPFQDYCLEIPWTEEPGRLQSMGSQRVRHGWATSLSLSLSSDHEEKKETPGKKTLISASLTMLKPLTLWIITNCGKLLKKWEYQTTLPVSWETFIQFKKQQLEPDTEQLTGWKLGKQYIKAAYCHPAYLTYMQST